MTQHDFSISKRASAEPLLNGNKAGLFQDAHGFADRLPTYIELPRCLHFGRQLISKLEYSLKDQLLDFIRNLFKRSLGFIWLKVSRHHSLAMALDTEGRFTEQRRCPTFIQYALNQTPLHLSRGFSGLLSVGRCSWVKFRRLASCRDCPSRGSGINEPSPPRRGSFQPIPAPTFRTDGYTLERVWFCGVR